MTEVKTIKLSPKGQICIPQDMREDVDFKEGEKLVLVTKDKEIIIKKSKDFLKKFDSESKDTMLMSESSLKKDWDNEYDARWDKY